MWRHIRQIVEGDMAVQLHTAHKITSEHINLTSYSTMNVQYAEQVLSQSVGEILKQYYPNQVIESTAQLCLTMDSFFDCLNVRSFTEH